MPTDVDGHFPVKPFQAFEQLVYGKAPVLTVQQRGDFRRSHLKQRGNFPRFKLPGFEQRTEIKADLRPREQRLGVLQP